MKPWRSISLYIGQHLFIQLLGLLTGQADAVEGRGRHLLVPVVAHEDGIFADGHRQKDIRPSAYSSSSRLLNSCISQEVWAICSPKAVFVQDTQGTVVCFLQHPPFKGQVSSSRYSLSLQVAEDTRWAILLWRPARWRRCWGGHAAVDASLPPLHRPPRR